MVSYGVWYGLDSALGRGLAGQIVSVLTALTAGVAVYGAAVWAMRLPEALQIKRLLVVAGAPDRTQLRGEAGFVFEIQPRDPRHPDPLAGQPAIARTILVEGPARVVGLRAVDLDREPGVGPVGIDLVAGNPDVELRLGKGVVLAKPLEPPLGLAADDVRVRAIGGQDPMQAVPADATGQSGEGAVDGLQVEDALNLGLVNGLGKARLALDVGEVDQRAGDAGDRDAAHRRAVLVVNEAGAVEDDARGPCAVGHRDLELRRRGEQALGGPGGAVAEQRVGPAGQHGGHASRIDVRARCPTA